MKQKTKVITCLLFVFAIFIPSSQIQTLPLFLSKLPFVGDNFHCVEKNRFYRSNQLRSKRSFKGLFKNKFKKYFKKYGIKSVLNLRGINDEDWWYEEQKACNKYGVILYNVALTEHAFPTREQIEYILDVFDNAPKPILVHCKSGSDRTGMICGLYAKDQMDHNTKKALRQLKLVKYGHSKTLHPKMSKFVKTWQNRDWFYKNYHY